jgi:hypothetical protein
MITNTFGGRSVVAAVVVAAAVACGRPTPSSTSEHIRGTVESFDGRMLTVSTAAGTMTIQVAPSVAVGTVRRADRSSLTQGNFVGITSITEPDGSQRAIEVHVFPESMRGTGEGSYPWDLGRDGATGDSKMTNGAISASRMTNGTVSVSRMTNGTIEGDSNQLSLTVSYRDGAEHGSQTIVIPPDIPIVGVASGQLRDLEPGVHVFVVAHRNAGDLIADRILAGKDGEVPPM